MKVRIENTIIELTPAQITIIQKERKKRERCRNSFKKTLKHFGFKPIKDTSNCYQNPEGWFAEILDRGAWSEVWITGRGLKEINGFPGGWIYSSPQEIEEELIKM